MKTTQRNRGARKLKLFVFALLLLQVLLAVHARLFPIMEGDDGKYLYRLTRAIGIMEAIPLFGLMHHITGEPVQLLKTDKETGVTTEHHFDLVRDAQQTYPVLAGKPYTRRLLDR
jgi:hypothetical protein